MQCFHVVDFVAATLNDIIDVVAGRQTRSGSGTIGGQEIYQDAHLHNQQGRSRMGRGSGSGRTDGQSRTRPGPNVSFALMIAAPTWHPMMPVLADPSGLSSDGSMRCHSTPGMVCNRVVSTQLQPSNVNPSFLSAQQLHLSLANPARRTEDSVGGVAVFPNTTKGLVLVLAAHVSHSARWGRPVESSRHVIRLSASHSNIPNHEPRCFSRIRVLILPSPAAAKDQIAGATLTRDRMMSSRTSWCLTRLRGQGSGGL